MELITPPQPTKLEFLEYLKQLLKQYGSLFDYINYDYELYYIHYDLYGYEYGIWAINRDYELTLADIETSPFLLLWFEKFQSDELRIGVMVSQTMTDPYNYAKNIKPYLW